MRRIVSSVLYTYRQLVMVAVADNLISNEFRHVSINFVMSPDFHFPFPRTRSVGRTYRPGVE